MFWNVRQNLRLNPFAITDILFYFQENFYLWTTNYTVEWINKLSLQDGIFIIIYYIEITIKLNVGYK